MTKTEGKRGYARSQPALTVDAAKVAAFEQTWAAFDTEHRAFEARPYDSTGNLPADATDAMDEAADAVFSAPAPHGEALARKIALFAYPNHIDGWLTDPALRAKVAAEDDEDAKRLLVMFLDALALSGVPASIDVPQVVKTSARVTAEYDRALALIKPYHDAQDNDDDAPDPPRALRDRLRVAYDAFVSTRADDLGHVARKISMFAMELLGLDVDVPEELNRALAGDGLERHVAEFFQQATALSASPIASVSAGDWHMLALRSELIAKRCADTQWSRYAVNPLGLAGLVALQTGIQEDIRLLAADFWPGAVSEAMNVIYGPGPSDDDPGDGPKGGPPRPPTSTPHDADTQRVVALDVARQRLFAAYEACDEDEALWEAALAAEAELRALPCTSVVSAAIKLAAFAEGFEKGPRGDDEAMFKQVLGYLISIAGDNPDRSAWDAAAADVIAQYAKHDDVDSDALAAAVDRLMLLTPPDLEGFRLLFEVIATETQALGLREASEREHGPTPLTDARLCDSVDWPTETPCVVLSDGRGLQAGLVHLRRALDRMTNRSASPLGDADAGQGEA